MAKKKEENKEILELKKGVDEGLVCIGAKETIKQLNKNNLSKIYLASNCPEKIKKEIEHYASLTKTLVAVLDKNNEEVGGICKKHFFISVLGLKKGQ